jgi:hypothetical protein
MGTARRGCAAFDAARLSGSLKSGRVGIVVFLRVVTISYCCARRGPDAPAGVAVADHGVAAGAAGDGYRSRVCRSISGQPRAGRRGSVVATIVRGTSATYLADGDGPVRSPSVRSAIRPP